MGYYINSPNKSKEEWLQEYGQVTTTPAWPAPEGTVPVCLIDNGAFTAAGIAYDEAEFNAFMAPDSGMQRPRTWYYVPREKVLEAEPLVQDLLD
ncbi:hypothetical protein LCGC14_3045560 [marine sediment metagenome]|uniref:Uncharacterized protein n=1 Tax=marine sediment metagenome TaxID=412755 RepID=A0A0F8XBI4_9ZZZZ